MTHDCEKQAARETIKTMVEKWESNGYTEKEMYQLEEKIMFSESLMSRITVAQCEEYDKNIARITNYSKKSKRELLLDVNELLAYLDQGKAQSGYLFRIRKIILGQKNLRKRLSIIDEVVVDGKPAYGVESLWLIQNVLRVDLTLKDLTHIWGTQQHKYASQLQQYQFFKFLLVAAMDCIRNYNVASLPLENFK